jgi:hypothetical protein
MTDDQSFQTNLIDGIQRFQSARSRAFWQAISSLLRGKSAELLSFDDIRHRLRLHQESYKGLQDIPLDKIRGSVGRYRDFNSSFLPRSNDMQERWSRVYAVASGMMGLPPIDVYQVGDVYFVRDGNHRVSVSKEMGAKTIQAHVTELSSPVPFYAGMTDKEIDEASAYAAFLQETGLSQTRRHHQSLRLSDSSRYPDLIGLIAIHREIMSRVRGQPVALEQAAADWYDHVYRPAVTLMRKYKMMDEHPERTEADLFLWMVGNLGALRHAFEDQPEEAHQASMVEFLRSRGMNVPDDFLADAHDPAALSLDYMEQALELADDDGLDTEVK